MDISDIGVIVENCKKGDKEAWKMIIQTYSKTVFNIALNFIGDRDLAADITQDVFLKVYNNIDKFRNEKNFGAWVHTICKNYCIDYWRKNKKHIYIDESDENIAASIESPEERTIKNSEIRFLRSQLMKLDPDIRLFLILRDILNLSYQQIAERFDLPEGTVKSRINRARLKLSQLYLNGVKKDGMY